MSHEHTTPITYNGDPGLGERQEILQYVDGQAVLSITGEPGDRFDWDRHKYSPTQTIGAAIVATKSGNAYYITGDSDWLRIVNMGQSLREKKLVEARMPAGSHLNPIEFGRSWSIPDFFDTTPVEKVLLRYKTVPAGRLISGGRMIDQPGTTEPNPFDQYARLVQQFRWGPPQA